MRNAKPFIKSIRAEIIKIIQFKIKAIIYKKKGPETATILKTKNCRDGTRNQSKNKEKRKKIDLHNFDFHSTSKKTQGKFPLLMIN